MRRPARAEHRNDPAGAGSLLDLRLIQVAAEVVARSSRELPVPYSWPASTINGVPASAYFSAASKMLTTSPWPATFVTPPSTPGTIRFLMRTFANVPRVITRSLPRREP